MKKRGNRRTPARRMIPWTQDIGNQAFLPVMQLLAEHGLIEVGTDPEAAADEVERVFRDHGVLNAAGDAYLGKCVLLPSSDRGFSLLIATPCQADEYDSSLHRKPSPVTFDRTAEDRIILPGRWLLALLEDLARNPQASNELRADALNISRRGEVAPIVLPVDMETVALRVIDKDGSVTTIEALLPESIISVTPK